jgi:putative SOS response-associated peptidase YedK
MCYSALVQNDVKKLAFKYKARIQYTSFEDLFRLRLEHTEITIPRALEQGFKNPITPQEKRIWRLIQKFRDLQREKFNAELEKQANRNASAKTSLKTKVTKKAQEDLRISGNKIEDLSKKLEALDKDDSPEYARIFPHHYSCLVVNEGGERVVRPFRYHLRPKGKPASFDRQLPGNYNARNETLAEKGTWAPLFGKQHGVLTISAFYENVPSYKFEKRKPKPGEEEKPINVVLRFDPKEPQDFEVPCVFDLNTNDGFDLHSFALITGEPNPEVAATGHERTPIFMKPKYTGVWLTPGLHLDEYRKVFSDKQLTFFEHEQVAA